MQPHLLIVDDEAVSAMALRDCALAMGYGTVDVADGVAEALTILESRRPDLMILDINLHGRKSYDVAARATRLGVPFVFLSGYGRNYIPIQYLKIDVLEKPYSMEAVREVLGGRILATR